MNKALCCNAEVVAVTSDNGVVGRDVEGHHTNDRIESECEEGHGEGTALFDSRGEEDGECDEVVYEDVV